MTHARHWRLLLVLAVVLGWPARADAQSADRADADTAETAAPAEGPDEQMQTLIADMDKLKKFKFSGYVQVRWETSENKSDSVRVTGSPATITPANTERFYIRRARLKLTYDSSPLSQAVVYIDGGADRTVRLLEAYVTLRDPWTVLQAHQLTIGQFNLPFGYEIERSSSLRELPERSRAENVLFPGERDRGVKLVDQWTPQLETVVGLFNGTGISNADFPIGDPTRGKDFTARARWSQGTIDAAVSVYDGLHVTPLTGGDVETDKTRLGFDAQAFYELPSLGGGTLRGEWYLGHEVNPDSVRALTIAPSTSNPVRLLRPGADPAHFATDFSGGYVMWVQNLGDHFQAAARWDAWDPDVDVDHDQYWRVGVGFHWFYDGFTRLSLAYEAPRTEVATPAGYDDPGDNLWTVQVQHKF